MMAMLLRSSGVRLGGLVCRSAAGACPPSTVMAPLASPALRKAMSGSASGLDTHGASHWKLERGISVGLVALIPAAVLAPGPAVDMAIAVALPAHNYIGMDVVITDYLHGAVNLPVAKALNVMVGVGTAAALVYFNVNDVGVCEGVKQLWSI